MKKILFLIHDLGVGGAEKVLVNLVNHMDREQFDITVIALFGGGVNEQFLAPHVHYKTVWKHTFRGNSMIMKLFTPEQLHRFCIRDHYDIEVAYLESTISRIISGCNDPDSRLFSWIHIEQRGPKRGAGAFRSYTEAVSCYSKFDQVVCVSESVKVCFQNNFPQIREPIVLYNTVETDKIRRMSNELVEPTLFRPEEIKLVGVGKISKRKGFDRIARIILRLKKEGFPVHFYALGMGEQQIEIEQFLVENGIQDSYTFLGYQTNPYKYVSRCDLFLCASVAEGFSTAATEALIVGTPICTVEVSGMKEMLGANNEWGVVTENSEESLYESVKKLLLDPCLLKHYKEKAKERGEYFSTSETVSATQKALLKE